MDIVSILNKLPSEISEKLMELPAGERELIYTRGISASLLEEAYKNKKSDLMLLIKNDPELFNVKNIPDIVVLKAAKDKILECPDIQQLHQYLDYLGISEEVNYKINDVNQTFSNH